MTFVYAWMVLRNFGRGLKDQSTSTRTFLVVLLNLNLTLFSSLSETGGYWRKAQRVPVVVCATQPDEHRLSPRPSRRLEFLLCEYIGSASTLRTIYRWIRYTSHRYSVTSPEINIIHYNARLCCCWASPKRSTFFHPFLNPSPLFSYSSI